MLVGDLGDQRCGVGRSTAALLDARDDVVVLDPSRPGLRAWWSACRNAALECGAAVMIYPTRSTFERPRTFVHAYLAALAFGRKPFRTYLHEYSRFGRKHRPFVATLAWLGSDGIIVSTQGEADALRRRWPGLLTRRRSFIVVPPVNGTAPAASQMTVSHTATGTAGVFGMPRPDKDIDWISKVVTSLPSSIKRLQLAGSGWETEHLPDTARRRLDVEVLGHVADGDLEDLFRQWDLAIAPFADGPHDGRLSLRTPLAYGVPTITSRPRVGELTLETEHLCFEVDDIGRLLNSDDRGAWRRQVADYEADVRQRLRVAVLGSVARDG